jgi:hypothetical protein
VPTNTSNESALNLAFTTFSHVNQSKILMLTLAPSLHFDHSFALLLEKEVAASASRRDDEDQKSHVQVDLRRRVPWGVGGIPGW